MPVEDGVCAVVVTFHPDAEVAENLRLLLPQVERVFVVDNGSTAKELEPLRGLNLSLIENGTNLGIATALNVGIRAAQAEEFGWVLLFDQDSRVTEGFAEQMLADFRTSRWAERLRILTPRYVDRRTGVELKSSGGTHGLDAATTSGSLTRMATFDELGFFADELFIDQVDYELSLRVRAAGGVIAEGSAVLLHAPGEPKVGRLFGRNFRSANYSPLRRYYQERNKVWMLRRYGRRFPGFCWKQFAVSTEDLVKVLAVEEDKVRKCRAFLHGWRDGVRGRMGPVAG